ncbi:MAG: hypothetical protein O3B24_11130 [Verrucomicrobia bacterium]|nr:hypothetical protein [Verrucomicrobiota bacterium]
MTLHRQVPLPPTTPSRLPIILSALVYPGAGQFAQKRWIAGAWWSLVFSGAGVWFAVELGRILIAYYGQMVQDFPTTDPPGFVRMLLAFGAALLCYTASLIDTFLAHARIGRPSPDLSRTA